MEGRGGQFDSQPKTLRFYLKYAENRPEYFPEQKNVLGRNGSETMQRNKVLLAGPEYGNSLVWRC